MKPYRQSIMGTFSQTIIRTKEIETVLKELKNTFLLAE
jgi:hypothetical protein